MRKTLVTAGLAAVSIVVVVSPANAQSLDPSESLGSVDAGSVASSELVSAGSVPAAEMSLGASSAVSPGSLAVGLGSAALAGLASGGVFLAVQAGVIPNPLPGIIPEPGTLFPAPSPFAPAPMVVAPPAPAPVPAPVSNRRVPPPGSYFKNCSDVRAQGYGPIFRGEPGYRDALDRDQDGKACE